MEQMRTNETMGGTAMETLIKLVQVIAPIKGYELHYRVEGSSIPKIVFVAKHGGK